MAKARVQLGDTILVVDCEVMKGGVDRSVSPVIDIEDKIASLAERDSAENKLQVILRGMHSLIGESANCATTYQNKQPQTIRQKKVYEKYIDILSVVSGKAIDAAKTGVLFHIPRHIAKYGKPVPKFMKYAGEYYAGLKKFLKSQSNMNRLCFDVEKWHKSIKWARCKKNFDYTLMIDDNVETDKGIGYALELIFERYCTEYQETKKVELSMLRKYGSFDFNWNDFFDRYRELCREACPNGRMLANILVRLHYEKYPRKKKNFMWYMAGDDIARNIKQADVLLPMRDEESGKREFLGKMYRMELPGNGVDSRKVGDEVGFDWVSNELEDFWDKEMED